MAFGSDFGEQQLTLGTTGALRTPSGPIRTRYAIVPARLHVAGRLLARDQLGKLVLIVPSGGVLRVPSGTRSLLGCSS
jgi:hypothetical protein